MVFLTLKDQNFEDRNFDQVRILIFDFQGQMGHLKSIPWQIGISFYHRVFPARIPPTLVY